MSFISIPFTNNPDQKKKLDKEMPDLLLITDLGFPPPYCYKNLMAKLKLNKNYCASYLEFFLDFFH